MPSVAARSVLVGSNYTLFCICLVLVGAVEAKTYFSNVTREAGLDVFPGLRARNIEVPETAVLEDHTDVLPEDFVLDQNYPNPFNSGTVIRFALPQIDEVTLSLYNLTGQKVATLLDGPRAAGAYTIRWDGRDEVGQELASGVYLYRLQAGTQVETRKLLLLR